MSKLKLTTIANVGDTASVPADTVIAGSAKAWVTYKQTTTASVLASFNASSVTDVSTGVFAINFTNAMSNANYSVGSCQIYGGGTSSVSLGYHNSVVPTTTTLTIRSLYNAAVADNPLNAVQVFSN